MGVVGIIMVTLRAAMFPVKKIYEDEDLSVTDVDEKTEWEEYQAYLRLAGNFIRSIGSFGNDQGTAGIGCKETFSTEVLSDSTGEVLELSSTVSSKEGDDWHNRPQAYHYSPRHMSTNPFDDDFDESNFEEDDEERAPLSPSTPTVEYLSRKGGQSDGASTARKRTPRSLATESKDEEMQDKVTPHNRPSPRHDGELRLRTPTFLSPGTFRRWRQRDDEDSHVDDDTCSGLPKTPLTPLVQSPGDERGRTGNFISLLTRDSIANDKVD